MPHQRNADPLTQINTRHPEQLLLIARALAGHPDATAAAAVGIDRFGIDLRVDTPAASTTARAEFAEPVAESDYPDGLRVAFVRLARRAQIQADDSLRP